MKEISECWNLLMNTLGIGIEIEENMKREWIFKDKNTGKERARTDCSSLKEPRRKSKIQTK